MRQVFTNCFTNYKIEASSFIILLSLLAGCNTPSKTYEIDKLLTNDGQGVYWDLICSTDFDGNYLSSYTKSKLPLNSLFLGKNRTALLLYNFQSDTSIYADPIEQDIQHSKEYETSTDVFIFEQDTFSVDLLNDKYFIMHRKYHPKARRIYMKSFKQKRTIKYDYKF